MSGDGDRPDYLDREKKSFSELDRLRRERRDGGSSRPSSPAAQRRSAEATKSYLKQIDGLFQGGPGAQGEELSRAVLDARGTPGLPDACRAYLDALGVPSQTRLLSCFLDTGVAELELQGLEGLCALREAGSLEAGAGLRTQLRLLAQGPDDAVADLAEELLEQL